VFGEFGTVVESDCFDPGCGQIDEEFGDGFCDHLSVFAQHFGGARQSCATLDVCYKKTLLVLTEDGIGFPVSGFDAFFYVCRAVLNTHLVRNGWTSACFSLSAFSAIGTCLKEGFY